VLVALLIQHAAHRHVVICGLSSSAMFFDIISQTVRFSEKKLADHKMCFDFLYSFYVEHFSL
jgi:hypothetical protein